MLRKWIEVAANRPKTIMLVCAIAVLAAVFQFPRIKVDTDPENMLSPKAPVRVFHNKVKKEFALYDFIVLGIVNTKNPDGVFNVDTLGKVYAITEKIKKIDGVIDTDIISPSTKDNIIQEGLGTISFDWFMPEPPKTKEQALAIRDAGKEHPMFAGSIVSEDDLALSIFVPIQRKDISYTVAQKIRQITDEFPGDEQYYITGQPVAQDQFGVEMFKQMAISAPLAGLVIFILMWVFFKSITLIIAPMVVAVITVLITMGLLIGFGFPVHIMSSMIPIFLMPISVLDSVHILSEFFDTFKKYNNRKDAILAVTNELFTPMLYTSLTSMAGFVSLAFAPIPPVQVFGVFVATGVAVAWLLTMLFIPAYIMLMSEKSLENFGSDHNHQQQNDTKGIINHVLNLTRRVSVGAHKLVLTLTLILVGVSVYGISLINVNDNPVRWFGYKHPIRVADRILNNHFAGTYTAYYVIEAKDKNNAIFIEPEMLRWIEKLQKNLLESGTVGKVTSVADIVKKVYYELMEGDKTYKVIPDTRQAVAQCLIQLENSNTPDDIWHMTIPDYTKGVLWVQLKSGDNQDMEKVRQFVDNYTKQHPAPFDVSTGWAGLTFINVVWQNEMVVGMLKNFLGSFIIVLFMMLFLFRSPIKALISMVPLSVTIVFIYSLLGFVGKDYDMPVAVLSALTLGLSVDFAIHFIQRAIELNDEYNSWTKTAIEMFHGPGRAILRNALVVAIGFLPLLAAPLVPYQTVGFFMLGIMFVSGIGTLFILPAIITVNPKAILAHTDKGIGCKCSHCVLTSLFVGGAAAYVLNEFTAAGWNTITTVSVATVVILGTSCFFASKRKSCFSNKNKGDQ